MEYAQRLKALADQLRENVYLVMRLYPEKSRTALGWKGYVYDPYLDGSNNLQDGIINTRKLMSEINEIGIPIATEILSPHLYLNYQDLISWAAIGARSVESQIHREIASNLDMPVGFKNNLAGNIDVAVNAINFAMHQSLKILPPSANYQCSWQK